MELRTEALTGSHIRDDFSCGQELLDNYLKKQAGQDMKRKLAACFVITPTGSQEVTGYYTLSNASIPQHLIPNEIRKRLPGSYKDIPVTLLGRLARDLRFVGRGIGEFLLMDALYRAYGASKNIASFAVVVDPIDERAIAFYEAYGFILLPDSGKMFLPMKTISQLFP